MNEFWSRKNIVALVFFIIWFIVVELNKPDKIDKVDHIQELIYGVAPEREEK